MCPRAAGAYTRAYPRRHAELGPGVVVEEGPLSAWWRATVVALAALVAGAGGALRAQGAQTGWEATGLAEAVTHLETSAGGAFYAVARAERPPSARAWRSDDGGATWRPVGLPPEAGAVYVDPVDHDVLYAASGIGMHKSAEGGGTWALVLPQRPPGAEGWSPYSIRQLAISPADRNRIYLETFTYPGSVGQVVRSLDGGVTWEVGEKRSPGSPSFACSTTVVLAHATDPDRLLRAHGCQLAESEPVNLYQSRDWGATWQSVGQTARPDAAVGWRGVRPERLYMAVTVTSLVGPGKQTRPLGSVLRRSDDDGQHWQDVLDLTAEGVPDSGRSVTALAYDPGRPDTVYAAVGAGVRVSADAGATWADLGRQDLPPIKDLALGVDGLNLYAATQAGVLRLRLSEGAVD